MTENRTTFSQVVETRCFFDATADRIWRVLTQFDAYRYWNPFIEQVCGPLAQGEVMQLSLKSRWGWHVRLKAVVVGLEPHARIEWMGSKFSPSLLLIEHRLKVVRNAEGAGAEVIHSERVSGLLLPLFRWAIKRDLQAGFANMNASFKSRLGIKAERWKP